MHDKQSSKVTVLWINLFFNEERLGWVGGHFFIVLIYTKPLQLRAMLSNFINR